MIASNCPRCDEAFRLPAGHFPDDAYAQCPWCRETFPISEVIEKLPPVLQVLSADGQPLSDQGPFVASAASAGFAHGVAEAESAVDPTPAADGYDTQSLYSEPQSLYPQDAASEPGFEESESAGGETVTDEAAAGGTGSAEGWSPEQDVDEDAYADADSFVAVDHDQGEAWSDDEAADFSLTDSAAGDEAIAPMKVSPAPTRSRKKGSSIRTLIGIGLGPVIALPLAGIILLAFGRAPDLGFWPFDGSFSKEGKTQTYASRPSGTPRSIPTNSTGRSLATDLTPKTSNQDADPVADALSQISGKPKPDDTLPEPNDDPSAVASADASDAGASITMPPADEPIQITEPTPDSDRVADQPAAEDVAAGLEMPDLPTETNEPVVAPPSDDPAAVKSAVEMASATESSADPAVADATAKASELLNQLVGFEGPEKTRRPLLAKTYAAIAEVAAVAGDKDSGVDALVGEIAQSSLLDDLGAAAPQWLNYPKRTTDGILLVGAPGTGADGPTIKLPTGNEVSVTGSIELPDAKRVLGLGRIVESPSGQTVELVVAEPLQ